jgi:hypothetical protein
VESVRFYKEAIIAYFMLPPCNSPRQCEVNYKILSQNSHEILTQLDNVLNPAIYYCIIQDVARKRAIIKRTVINSNTVFTKLQQFREKRL